MLDLFTTQIGGGSAANQTSIQVAVAQNEPKEVFLTLRTSGKVRATIKSQGASDTIGIALATDVTSPPMRLAKGQTLYLSSTEAVNAQNVDVQVQDPPWDIGVARLLDQLTSTVAAVAAKAFGIGKNMLKSCLPPGGSL